MRVHEIHCPKCDTTLRSKAGIPVGQAVSCPKCNHKFTAREPDEVDAEIVDDEDDGEERTPARRKGSPASPRRRADRDDGHDEDERPRKKKSVSARKGRDRDDDEDDDYDRPRKKKKRRREDDDEPQSLYWRLRRNIAVRIITLVVLLGILAVLAYMLYEQRRERERLENGSLAAPTFALAPDALESASTGKPE
jgi:hypothetical protein